MTWQEIPWGKILLVIYAVVLLLCVLRVLYKQHNIGTAFAWLLMLFAFPVVGVILYALIGEPRLGMARAKRTEEMNRFYGQVIERYLDGVHLEDTPSNLSPRYHGLGKMASCVTVIKITNNNAIALLSTTETIVDSMLADIEAAELSCLLVFYIIDPKGKIETLLKAVEAAAQRGVECMILADAVGSKNFFNTEWPARLAAAGVGVQAALPVGLWRTLFTRSDLRNHRKILIVDKKIGYTGSYNLVDPKWFKQGAGVGEWIDVMMRCTGPLVLEMAAVFYADMAVENDDNLNEVLDYLSGFVERIPTMLPDKMAAGNVMVQLIPSAPDQAERVIYETIICAIHMAEQKIVITTPYFVPDEPLLTALTTAAKRGVDVTLVLPKKVDSLMVRYASRAYYPMLLDAGVKIALFEEGLLHAKTMTIDSEYTLFGTVNMDMRSFFLNLEISLAIYDLGITAEVEALQQQYLTQSRLVTRQAWQQRAKGWGLIENTVRLMSPLL